MEPQVIWETVSGGLQADAGDVHNHDVSLGDGDGPETVQVIEVSVWIPRWGEVVRRARSHLLSPTAWHKDNMYY